MKRIWYTHRLASLFYSYFSQKKILFQYPEFFPEFLFHIIKMDEEWQMLSLSKGYQSGFDGLLKLIRDRGAVDLISVYFHNSAESIVYKDGSYIYQGSVLGEDALKEALYKLRNESIITEHLSFESDVASSSRELSLVSMNGLPVGIPVLTDAFFYEEETCPTQAVIENGIIRIEEYDEDISTLIEMVISASQYLSFYDVLEFRFCRADSGWIIRRVSPSLQTPLPDHMSEELQSYTENWIRREANPTPERIEILAADAEFQKKWQNAVIERHRTGMRPYLAYMYEDELAEDLTDTSVTEEDRRWTSERGFFAYRIKDIGLTPENYSNYLSDYDYYWLNRINGDYACWINNKLAMRYALDEYREYLPDYYYSVCTVNGKTDVRGLPDLDKDRYETSFNGIFSLLKNLGVLAVKKAYGTHGEGFYMLEYKEGFVMLNGIRSSEDEVIKLLTFPETVFILTEYVRMHSFFSDMYSKSLNTVRVNVFSRPGERPVIGACFLRVGHSAGGYTDNINAGPGGIIVALNKKNGNLEQADFKRGIHYSLCNIHPDTGTPISGTIPSWDHLISVVEKISASIPQLQYLAFDIGVTPDSSIKIIEINVFPDYTKYLLNDPEMQVFLKEKYLAKCKKYCIDTDIHTQFPQKQKFKISVVMALYNVDSYLREAIESVINQSMAFKENIQLILVNDGSTDNTEKICKEYTKKYPENIVYIVSENHGVSHARNLGIEKVSGELVTFLDGDDKWEKNSFKSVWTFFKCNPDIEVADCRTMWFEAKTGPYSLDYRFSKGSRVVDINKEPENIIVAVNSSFFRASAIGELRFCEDLIIGEDSRFANEVLLNNMKLGLVKDATYMRRSRERGDSLTQNSNKLRDISAYTHTQELYYKYCYELSKEKYGRVVPYIQYLILDAVRYRNSHPIPDNLTEDEKQRYRDTLISIINDSDSSIISNLRNGAVGEKTNLLRNGKRALKAEEVSFDGSNVIVDGLVIGRVRTEVALGISEVHSGVMHTGIKGKITLPWFIEAPVVKVISDKEATPFYAKLGPARGRFIDMFGNPYYNDFNISLDFKLRGKASLRFFLITKDGELPLRINPILPYRKKQPKSSMAMEVKSKPIKKKLRSLFD